MGDSVDDLLGNYSPEIRDLCFKLRDLVLGAVPDADERVRMGWRNIGYSHGGGMKGQFCAIAPYKSHVNLYFNQGADLEDPEGLLDGTGKKMRHVRIQMPDDIQADALVALIRAAAKYSRDER